MQSVLPRRPFAVPAWLRLAGPAFAVSIGYVDPGNWASDLAAGAYGFRLLWVIVAANIIAIVLQTAVTKLTIAEGRDLGALIAARWPRARTAFWCVFQCAAIATDIAEFTGIVVGAQLIFRLPTALSVAFGIVTVYAILAAGQRRPRLFDVAMVAAIAAMGVAFAMLAAALHPALPAVISGALVPVIPDGAALFIVVAIVGATVMPHNLFLHSALIESRTQHLRLPDRVRAGRYFGAETLIALTVAAVINGGILIVGAALGSGATSIEDAFGALRSVNGSTLFGAALLISGIAATATATLSGDVICARFSTRRISPLVRRTATALPAAVLLVAGASPTVLLLWSQCALCLVLPCAVVPLLLLMRGLVGRRFFRVCLAVTALCIALNVALIYTSLFRG